MSENNDKPRIYAVDPDDTDEASGELIEVVGETTEEIPDSDVSDYQIVEVVPEDELEDVVLEEDEIAFGYDDEE